MRLHPADLQLENRDTNVDSLWETWEGNKP